MAIASVAFNKDGDRPQLFKTGSWKVKLQKGKKELDDGGRRVYCTAVLNRFLAGAAPSLPDQDGLTTDHQVAEPTFCSEEA